MKTHCYFSGEGETKSTSEYPAKPRYDDDFMAAHSRSCSFCRNDVLAHDEEQEEDEAQAFIFRIMK